MFYNENFNSYQLNPIKRQLHINKANTLLLAITRVLIFQQCYPIIKLDHSTPYIKKYKIFLPLGKLITKNLIFPLSIIISAIFKLTYKLTYPLEKHLFYQYFSVNTYFRRFFPFQTSILAYSQETQ